MTFTELGVAQPAPSQPASSQPVAPALAPEMNARLQQLNQRRATQAPAPAAQAGATQPPAPKQPAKRRHPAHKTRIAVLALSLMSTAGISAGFAATDGPTSSVAAGSGGIVTTTSAQVASGPIAVNGDVFVNKWGPVQVQATFGSSGEIMAVDAVQVPFVDSKSVRINNRAVPTLNNEAIAAQSSQVDTVSGATYTSVDYEKSLQSAIDAARAAGVTQLA